MHLFNTQKEKIGFMPFAHGQGQLNLMELKQEERVLARPIWPSSDLAWITPLTTEMLIVNATSKHHRMQCNYTAFIKEFQTGLCLNLMKHNEKSLWQMTTVFFSINGTLAQSHPPNH